MLGEGRGERRVLKTREGQRIREGPLGKPQGSGRVQRAEYEVLPLCPGESSSWKASYPTLPSALAELWPVVADHCGCQQLHEALEVKGLLLQGPPPACYEPGGGETSVLTEMGFPYSPRDTG